MLDILINGSTEVNVSRAEQCGSVATPPPASHPRSRRSHRDRRRPRRAPAPASEVVREVELLTPADVATLKAKLAKSPKLPDVDFSLFVQLDQDLDPEARSTTLKAVGDLTRRARWKQDTAAVEVSGANVRLLHALPGVSYVEPGQTLRGPEPLVGGAHPAPSLDLRRVDAQSKRHRYGRNVLVGIIDVQGFDFAHDDFIERDGGGTRWVAIWDQGGVTRPSPADARASNRFDDLDYGAEILKQHMDAAIAEAPGRAMAATSLEPQSARVPGSHGTHVASIAAGNRGVARHAYLAGVLVALRPEDMLISSSFYDSTRIADAVDYLLALAAELGGDDGPLPVSINISLGTNGHAHDTSSAMARWIDNALSMSGRCVSVAAGNAGQVEASSPTDLGFVLGRIHAGGAFTATGLRHELGWIVVGDERADISENEMEIWYGPQDRIDVEIRPPDGGWIGPIQPGQNLRNEVLDNGTVLSVHSETYYPANGANRISIVLSPFYGSVRNGVQSIGPIAAGEWRVRLTGTVVRDGRYDAWIERDDPQRVGGPTGRNWRFPSFFAPGSFTSDRMINSLACAERLLSVGNVDVAHNMAHVTSSRGPTRDGRFKPDIGADGTRVVAAGGFDRTRPWIEMTGTSMASPYVCGVAALMLGIAPNLTAAQILGIMRTTSAPLPGHDFAWRNDTGFGAIDAAACIEEAAHLQADDSSEPAVKLTVFYASDGDCLLLSSSDGHHVLVDGGRGDSFEQGTWPTLQALAKAKKAIDLVVVSHIDADHISGILWLMKRVAAWSVYDYQTTAGGNPNFPKPTIPRPPTIDKVWHNSWRAQLGDLAGPVEAFLSRVSESLEATAFDRSTASESAVMLIDALGGLAESIPDGVELRRIVDEETPIPRNTPFKDLVLLQHAPHVEKLGTARLTVIGPAKKHLETLRKEWRLWLENQPGGQGVVHEAAGAPPEASGPDLGIGGLDLSVALAAERARGDQLVGSLVAAAEIIHATDPSKVTPPNRASITLLAEEKKRTCLLTGDAAEEEILEGLEAAGRLVNGGPFWCNVVKIQHHGSEYNLSETFAKSVLADQYVFCADGAHENPNPSVVRTLIETRLAADPRPFTIWFNCSPERTLPNRRKAMRAAIRQATVAAEKNPAVTVNVLDAAKPFFEIAV